MPNHPIGSLANEFAQCVNPQGVDIIGKSDHMQNLPLGRTDMDNRYPSRGVGVVGGRLPEAEFSDLVDGNFRFAGSCPAYTSFVYSHYDLFDLLGRDFLHRSPCSKGGGDTVILVVVTHVACMLRRMMVEMP
jgi:hypothetical protein